MEEKFNNICGRIAILIGSPISFFIAVLFVTIWVAAGPFYNWSESHAFLLNDVTTCATFLLVFIIQNTQNRSTKEIDSRLEELKKLIKEINAKT